MCIKQGYVPPTCKMDGQMCWLLVQAGKDPCDGCNWNREECKGRIERKRQEEYESRLQKLHEKNQRAENHAACNTKIIMLIVTDLGRCGKPEIELKVNDIVNECGYVRYYEDPGEAIAYIPAIVKKYGVGQIQCEINGFGLEIYDMLKGARLGVDIVPLTYRRLTY